MELNTSGISLNTSGISQGRSSTVVKEKKTYLKPIRCAWNVSIRISEENTAVHQTSIYY